MAVGTKIGKVEPTEYPWSSKVTVIVGVDGLIVALNVATAPPLTDDAINVPVDALPRLVAVENVNVPDEEVRTV
jgi:hypothetical protein